MEFVFGTAGKEHEIPDADDTCSFPAVPPSAIKPAQVNCVLFMIPFACERRIRILQNPNQLLPLRLSSATAGYCHVEQTPNESYNLNPVNLIDSKLLE